MRTEQSAICAFCQRWATYFYSGEPCPDRNNDAVAVFEPLNPVVPGHLLVVPFRHVHDALADPEVTAYTMAYAAEVATPDCNLITSVGPAATQTVPHLHVHIVPRREGDGLMLPWTGQHDVQIGWADRHGRWIGPLGSQFGVSYDDRAVYVRKAIP